MVKANQIRFSTHSTIRVLSCAIALLDYKKFFQELSPQNCHESKGIANLYPYRVLVAKSLINTRCQCWLAEHSKLSFYLETKLGKDRIPDQSTDPYPKLNGEQT